MSQEQRYYIRQAGGNAQGPYDFSRIVGYRDAGRVRPGMEFSEDGETWWKGSDWPDLFPPVPPSAPRPPRQRDAPSRPRSDRPQRRPRRQRQRSSNGPLLAVVVLVVAGVGVAVALGGKDKTGPSQGSGALTTSPESSPSQGAQRSEGTARREARAPASPDPRTALLKKRGTKREFRKKIAEVMESPGGIGYGGEDEFAKALGEPDKTQTVGDSIYWYYKCADGTIQVVIAGVLHHGGGFVVTAINDF